MNRICGRALAGALLVIGAVSAFGSKATMAEGTASDAYRSSLLIERKAEDVWKALVTKSIVDTYYVLPVSADVTAAGQDIFYGTQEQQLITGKVLELQPPTVYKHSFKFAGDDQPDSVVTYTLRAAGPSTELTVRHEGYAKDSQPYADIAGGWPIILDKLKTNLEDK